MSKIISVEGLTNLRFKIKEVDGGRITMSELVDAIDYLPAPDFPEISYQFQKLFFETFESDRKNEFNLAKLLFENIRLNRSQAANNQYWTYLNINWFFKFIYERWINQVKGESIEIDYDEYNSKEIDRYFISLEPSQNSLIQSPIAGLWWAIELTIDESLEDKYHYSKIFLSDRNLRDKNLGTYQFIRNKNILFALLDFYQSFKDVEYKSERIGSEAIAQQMSKTLNQIGGLTVLSYLSKREISEILNQNKDLIIRRAYKLKELKKVSREKMQSLKNNR